MDEIKNLKHEAVFALIYCAIILTVMEYFLIPPRFEALYRGFGTGQWMVPTMISGLAWSVGCLFGYLIIPSIVVKFIYSQNLSDYGFSPSGFLAHMKTYVGLYVLMLPLIYLASQDPHFKNTYPFVPEAKSSLSNFIIWELAYILQFFCLEFFFRGYLLFTLEKYVQKYLAIAIMVVPYVMIHFHKPVYETLGAVVAGCILGWLSLRYRSWLGGAVLHSLVAITLDVSAGLF